MKRNDYFILTFAGIVLAAIFITPADGAQITNAFARIFIDGVNVFNAKSYNDPLEFISGTGISISPSAPNRITISSTAGPGGDTNTAQIGDAGTHTSIFSSRFNATKNLLKTFVCDGTVSCTTNTTDIRITGTSATAYTKINNLDGGDAKIVATNTTLSNTQATFKTLTQGTGITITNGSKTITISSTVSGGITELNSINGGDARLLKSNSTTEGVFKSLTAGSNIGITNGTDTITISASIPASIISINAQTGPAITIQGTSRNVTVASAGNIITLNLGDKAVTYDGTQTLTSKTMDGTLNTFLNIAQASITNLVSDLASKQAKSEKGQSNGYASLNSNTLVPSRELGSGSNTSSTYLRGDRTWATISSTDTNTAQIVSAGGVSVWKQRDNATQNTLYGFAAVAGNTTLTTGATTITINTGYNVMTTTGSNQTVYHSLNITAGNKLQSTPNSKWTSLNIGTLSADPTRLRQGDLWISGSSLKYNDNTNTTRTVSTGTGSGFTVIASSPTVSAKILASNTSNTAVIKSITQGTGISIVNGSQSITIGNSGVLSVSGTANNVTVSASTGNVGFNLGSNVVTTGLARQTVTKGITLQNSIQSQINGLDLNYTSKSADYTVVGQDVRIVVNAGTANRTITLPAASSVSGQIYIIERNNTSPSYNWVMVKAAGSDKIDGDRNYNITRNQVDTIFQSTGSGWTVMNSDDQNQGITNAHMVRGTGFNRWYTTSIAAAALTNAVTQTAAIQTYPFLVPVTTTFDRVEINVQTLLAGSTCRAGIYTDNGNSYPFKLVNGTDVGTISGAAAGRFGNTFTSPVTLKAGLYWLANQCSSAATLQLSTVPVGSVPVVLGYASTGGATNPVPATGWTVTRAYAAFPTNYPTGGAVITTAPYAVFLRATG